MAQKRCCGITRAGRPCSIDSACKLTDDCGRLVAEPLRYGGDYCIFHAKPFVTRPAQNDRRDRQCIVVFLDLESTGVNIFEDRVVEIAAVHAPQDPRLFGGSFSTTVNVDTNILKERGAAAAAVHGIIDEEIAAGPSFPEAWSRFLSWVECLFNNAVKETSDDSEDEPEEPQIVENPVLLLAGHNALRFDFPFLLCECHRHKISVGCFEHWLFVATLHIGQAFPEHGCLKLQCLIRSLSGAAEDLRAHRALDDCIAPRRVVMAFVWKAGVNLPSLMHNFAEVVDLDSSIAQISVLLKPSQCVAG